MVSAWRDVSMASRSCFFSRIIASSWTLLKGGTTWPERELRGTGMGWGSVGMDPGGPPPCWPAADRMAAAMLAVLGENCGGR